MSELKFIQDWYRSQCDGDWEHTYGIHLETLDNPGWTLRIDLIGTDQENIAFNPVSHNVGEHSDPHEVDWFTCHVKDGSWHGSGGPEGLETLISIFRTWINQTSQP